MADFAGDWASNPQYQQRIQQLLPKIRQVQQRYGLPDSSIPYILANAGIESRWNVDSRSGNANDVGLLQITPILAKDYNAPHTKDVNTQLDVIGQYYARGLKRGLNMDTLATGWNTGMGRAAQVDQGKRDWESVTPMAARYNRAVNNFVNSNITKQFLNNLGINYTRNQRSQAVSKMMRQFGIADAGPRDPMSAANFADLSEGLTGIPQEMKPLTPQRAPVDTAAQNIPMTDLQLDDILHTDLGLGERLF